MALKLKAKWVRDGDRYALVIMLHGVERCELAWVNRGCDCDWYWSTATGSDGYESNATLARRVAKDDLAVLLPAIVTAIQNMRKTK